MAMMLLAALAMAQVITIDAGSWQMRSLVRGTQTPGLRLACLDPGEAGWIAAIVPVELWRDCDLRHGRLASVDAPCRGGGRLRVDGTVGRDRFDLMVHRTGSVGANSAAAVSLHIEGNRIGDCTPSPRNF